MKVISEHTIEATREELAHALGYEGYVGMVTKEDQTFVLKVIGTARPPASPPLSLPHAHIPGARAAVAPGSRAVFKVEFQTTGDPVMLSAYANELVVEVRRMLDAHPEPNVTAAVSLEFE